MKKPNNSWVDNFREDFWWLVALLYTQPEPTPEVAPSPVDDIDYLFDTTPDVSVYADVYLDDANPCDIDYADIETAVEDSLIDHLTYDSDSPDNIDLDVDFYS